MVDAGTGDEIMRVGICDNCGAEVEIWTMTEINIGRSVRLLCPACYGSGTRDVKVHTKEVHRKRRREDGFK